MVFNIFLLKNLSLFFFFYFFSLSLFALLLFIYFNFVGEKWWKDTENGSSIEEFEESGRKENKAEEKKK